MKAIIPVAGSGTHLRPHTYTQPKALIPLAGKTVLDFIIDQLQESGISEFILILGYLGEKIEKYVSQKYPQNKFYFIYQTDLLGVGHAISLAKEVVSNDEMMVVLGDTICEFDMKELIQAKGNFIGVRKVEDPRDFGVASIDTNFDIEELVEKPHIPRSNMALVGIYKIQDTALLFSCVNEIFKNKKNASDYNFTEILQCMIAKGASFKGFKVNNWYNCGKKESLINTNAILLSKSGSHSKSSSNHLKNTIILDPVFIGEDCEIENGIIGPYVSIGNNTKINNCLVRNSIIGSYAMLKDAVLTDSIIGSDVVVKGLNRTLNIGDNTEIDFG